MVEGLLPTEDAEAPVVAGIESREGELRTWSDEVVSLFLAENQKFFSENDANAMQPTVAGSGPAAAIAKEPGHRVGGTSGQFFAKDVEIRHGMTLVRVGETGKPERRN